MKENGETVQGSFLVNVCKNYENLPENCSKDPQAYFYFVEYSTKECTPLLQLNNIKMNLNQLDNLNGFSIENKKEKTTFRADVICDQKFNYPNFTSHIIPRSNKTIFEIRSKFSCGSINTGSDFLENNKLWFCPLMMFIGAVLLCYGGIHFKTLMYIIAGVLVTLILMFAIFSLFDFKLKNSVLLAISGFCFGVSLFLRLIGKFFKYVTHAIVGYVGVTLGINLTNTIYPNSVLS